MGQTGPGGDTCLAPAGSSQAAIQPAPLLARVPDGEGGPVGEGLLLQEADTVGPDGCPVAGKRGWWWLGAVGFATLLALRYQTHMSSDCTQAWCHILRPPPRGPMPYRKSQGAAQAGHLLQAEAPLPGSLARGRPEGWARCTVGEAAFTSVWSVHRVRVAGSRAWFSVPTSGQVWADWHFLCPPPPTFQFHWSCAERGNLGRDSLGANPFWSQLAPLS